MPHRGALGDAGFNGLTDQQRMPLLLDSLTGRLGNDPETERRVMRGELAGINRLRLRRLLGELS